MRPILVTGGSGQLATALEAASGDRALCRVGRPGFDFDRPASLTETVAQVMPALVVNTAAWTAVDAAESEPEAAARANRDGPAEMARLCAEAGIPLIHISTDYVYDGAKGAPYVETDRPHPTGVYGTTKLAGEQAALATWKRTLVLRTAWVYGATGKNFVRTMLSAGRRAATSGTPLRVVADQRGCPTAAADLAAAVLAVADRISEGWRDEYGGVFHAAGSGATTWHGLACATFAAAAQYGGPQPEVLPISTADWPTPARRPADSRLDCTKLAAVFGHRLPEWGDGLTRTIAAIFQAEAAARAPV